MIFIVGGAYQGKLDYAKDHFTDGYQFINEFHKYVRGCMKQGGNPELEVKRLVNTARVSGGEEKLIIISDEVGSGLVPLDAFEREYREVNGRVNCYLASEASQVIRVTAGIGSRIKG